MTACKTFDYFFDLPGELREHILSYLLVNPDGILVNKPRDDDDDDDEEDYDGDDEPAAAPPHPSSRPVNYFLVSQAFNREATALFFGANAFHLEASGRKLAEAIAHTPRRPLQAAPQTELLLGRPEYAAARRRIRRAVLTVRRWRGVLAAHVLGPLADMVLAGALRSLEVRAAWQVKGPPAELFGSRLMRALFALLRDPDLQVRRLRFRRADGERVCRGMLCCGGDEAGDGAEDWVDVDVARLLRRYGQVAMEERIWKVGG